MYSNTTFYSYKKLDIICLSYLYAWGTPPKGTYLPVRYFSTSLIFLIVEYKPFYVCENTNNLNRRDCYGVLATNFGMSVYYSTSNRYTLYAKEEYLTVFVIFLTFFLDKYSWRIAF